jgi:hypothetical protein
VSCCNLAEASLQAMMDALKKAGFKCVTVPEVSIWMVTFFLVITR